VKINSISSICVLFFKHGTLITQIKHFYADYYIISVKINSISSICVLFFKHGTQIKQIELINTDVIY